MTPHGSVAGLRLHARRDEPVCPSCLLLLGVLRHREEWREVERQAARSRAAYRAVRAREARQGSSWSAEVHARPRRQWV